MAFPGGSSVFLALLGGFLPAILWLWFWLQEDRLHPEPRGIIILCFFLGILSVIPALFLERIVLKNSGLNVSTLSIGVLLLWAIIEEVLKYLAADIAALHRRECDEPIDYMIYLISAALGFAAAENTLFLLGVIGQGSLVEVIRFGNLRFIGASVLHILTSATIGLSLSLSFYKSGLKKKWYLLWGFIVAIGLHLLFNLFIMKGEDTNTFIVFCFVWAAVVVLLALFEKIKKLSARRSKI